MLARAGSAFAACCAAAALTGCGGGGDRSPALSGLPLAPHTQVSVQTRSCNRGSNAFCALDFLLVGQGYRSGRDLLRAETRLLRHHHWVKVNAPVGQELAADSPGQKLHVTYATASQELQAVALGWVKRPRRVTVALSHAMFAEQSVLAVDLQLGPG